MKTFIISILSPAFCGIVALLIVPVLISLAKKWDLYDIPEGRKAHKTATPTIGGVAIFLVFLISDLILPLEFISWETRIALAGLFVMALYDDINGLSAKFRLAIQFLLIFVLLSPFNFAPLVLLGLAFFVVLFVNAFNFIDGVDGLAGSFAGLSLFYFAVNFYINGQLAAATLSMCMLAGVLGFLKYNFLSAKIFLGDNGSMVIGLILIILGLQFFSTPIILEEPSALTRLLPVFALPVFDLIRVASSRVLKKQSPLSADRNHLHHLFIDMGWKSYETTLFICLIQTALIILIHTTNFGFIQTLGVMIFAYASYVMLAKIKLSMRNVKINVTAKIEEGRATSPKETSPKAA